MADLKAKNAALRDSYRQLSVEHTDAVQRAEAAEAEQHRLTEAYTTARDALAGYRQRIAQLEAALWKLRECALLECRECKRHLDALLAIREDLQALDTARK